MAYLKFSRDKRGYEHFYLVEPASRGKLRSRLLYWFRTPPNIKVGRIPFDSDMRRALEGQNPGVAFDWTAIVQTPIPPPSETEHWRERRRVERAMRSADVDDGAADPAPAALPVALPERLPEMAAPPADVRVESGASESDPGEQTADVPPASNPLPSPGAPPVGTGQKRRRRRRRGRKPQAQGEV